MKKVIYAICSFAVICAVSWCSSLSVQAVNNEEKEMFDLLGVTCTLDAKGEVIGFETSMDSAKITREIREKFTEKYGDAEEVGKFRVSCSYYEEKDMVIIAVTSNSNSVSLFANGESTIYINANEEFMQQSYESEQEQEVASVCIGNMELNDQGINCRDEYAKNMDGEFVMISHCDGEDITTYDTAGNVINRFNIKEGTTYDENNQPMMQELTTTDGNIIRYISSDIAQMVQEKINADQERYVYKGEDGKTKVTEDMITLIQTCQEAYALEMSYDEYTKKTEMIDKYAAQHNGIISLTARAQIMGVDKKKLLNKPEELTPEEHVESISEKGIAEAFLRILNAYRVENGLNELRGDDPLLQQVADIRGEEITYVMDKYHSRPLGGNPAPFNVGENIVAIPYDNEDNNEEMAQLMFQAWKDSPEHNRTMLGDGYYEVGIGVKFVKINGCYMAYAATDFSYMEDYENMAGEVARSTIAAGPQTSENFQSTTEYFYAIETAKNELLNEQMLDIVASDGNLDTSGMIKRPEETADGGLKYTGLEVVDGSGNKFALPNGANWDFAYADLETFDVTWDAAGNAYSGCRGAICFQDDQTGKTYSIYIIPECVKDEGSTIITYFLNQYSGNRIVLKPCSIQTLDTIFPGGYDANPASNQAYYISNGATCSIDLD